MEVSRYMMFATIDTITVIIALCGVVLGSGAGGLVGAIVMVKRLKLERQASEVKTTVDLRTTDIDEFKAMIPGGLGEIIKHWKEEATELYDEVDELREGRAKDHGEIIRLRRELADTQIELAHTRERLDSAEHDLASAKARIGVLEAHDNERRTGD